MNKALYTALVEMGCDEGKAKVAAENCPHTPNDQDMAIRYHAAQLTALTILKRLTVGQYVICTLLLASLLLEVLHQAEKHFH